MSSGAPRRNPFRKGTKHWLPDDVGAYDYLPVKDKNASVSRGVITLPDGKTVALEKLGKGHSTQAYQGADGWVYLVVNEDARDPAKDVLVDLTAHLGDDIPPFAAHFPWIEHVGWMPAGKSAFREPRYLKLSKGSVAAKQAYALNKAMSGIRYVEYLGGRILELKRAQTEVVMELARAGKVLQPVADAVAYLSDFLDNYGYGWAFEFPPRNLVQDDDGNLILLDVIFDRAALIAQRMKAAAAQRRGAW